MEFNYNKYLTSLASEYVSIVNIHYNYIPLVYNMLKHLAYRR